MNSLLVFNSKSSTFAEDVHSLNTEIKLDGGVSRSNILGTDLNVRLMKDFSILALSFFKRLGSSGK